MNVLTATLAAASAVALSVAPAGAEPTGPATTTSAGGATAGDGGTLDRLYARAEKATERFNAADVRAGRLREQLDRIQNRVARSQERVNRMRGALAALAGAQYRSGALDPALVLLLSAEPGHYLDQAAVLQRISSRQALQLRVVQGAQRALRQQRSEALVTLARLEQSRKITARYKKEVTRKLAAAQRLLNSLPAAERAAFRRAPRTGQDPGLPGPALPVASEPREPAGRSTTAFQAARRAVGAPYVWGQAGPTAFDCSGLTQWAYRQAGVAIPRTSQAQAFAGRSVPLDQARPGDLVAYRPDASHIAMYAGNGQVIHAPRPGARVRYDPVDMMPISAITRL